MKIVGSRKSKETKKLMKEMIPDELRDKDVLVNLGWSGFTQASNHELTINTIQGIRNCAEKYQMHKLFALHGVPSVTFFDFNTKEGRKNMLEHMSIDDKFVLRGVDILYDFDAIYDAWGWYDYVTLYERPKKEYRVLMFRGRPFRVMEKKLKEGHENDWQRHIENCDFKAISVRTISGAITDACIKACNAVGIDLAGVDVMVTEDDKVKVIEVNSAPSMNDVSIRKFFKRLQIWLRDLQE